VVLPLMVFLGGYNAKEIGAHRVAEKEIHKRLKNNKRNQHENTSVEDDQAGRGVITGG